VHNFSTQSIQRSVQSRTLHTPQIGLKALSETCRAETVPPSSPS